LGFSTFNGLGDGLFTIVPVMIIIGFVLVIGFIIVLLIQGAAQWRRNNASPVLSVEATVVAKRTNVSHHHHAGMNNMHHMNSASTTYFATFEVASGDRMEFRIRDTEYGLLAEKDKGTLTFQGTRYLGFERHRI